MGNAHAEGEGTPDLVRTWWALSRQLDDRPAAGPMAVLVTVGVGSASLLVAAATLAVLAGAPVG
ncbi:MAG: hypothetical protein ABEI31_09060 [Halodesulfurarchaeum sp.]